MSELNETRKLAESCHKSFRPVVEAALESSNSTDFLIANLKTLLGAVVKDRTKDQAALSELRRALNMESTKGAESLTVGSLVTFGRRRGQQTLGEIVKVNQKTFKVKTLESRGSRSEAGQVWGVPKSMCKPAS